MSKLQNMRREVEILRTWQHIPEFDPLVTCSRMPGFTRYILSDRK